MIVSTLNWLLSVKLPWTPRAQQAQSRVMESDLAAIQSTNLSGGGGGGLVAKSCLTSCDPMDYSPPVSSVHGISQASILEWVAISFFRNLPNPGIKPASPASAGRFFTTEPQGSPKSLYSGVKGKRPGSGDAKMGNQTGACLHGAYRLEQSRAHSIQFQTVRTTTLWSARKAGGTRGESSRRNLCQLGLSGKQMLKLS